VPYEVLIRTSSGRRSILIGRDLCVSESDKAKENRDLIPFFVASWLSLLADSPLKPGQKPLRVYNHFLKRIKLEGVKAIVLEFTGLAHKLVSSRRVEGLESSIGPWVDGFDQTPLFDEYHTYFTTGDVDCLKFIYTFLNFGKKIEYVDDGFFSTAFRSWIDVEKRLGDLNFRTMDILSLRKIIATVLPTFRWTDLRPKFGPGSVRERGVRARKQKLDNLAYDPVIDRFLLHGHIGMYGMGQDFGVSVEQVLPDPGQWDPARGVSSRSSLLDFAFKNLKTARSICMEPNTLMYFQQAILAHAKEYIRNGPLSRFITIEYQSNNRRSAFLGSINGFVDTIDLSSASDSLSLQLVKEVFPPSWLIPMLATRSESVIVPTDLLFEYLMEGPHDGDDYLEVRPNASTGEFEMKVKKFAPMGSALCFPTQCLLFACVCIYAASIDIYEDSNTDAEFLSWLTPDRILRACLSFRNDMNRVATGQYQPLNVYGDDICLDRKLTDKVTAILTSLGFVVNKEKSFVGDQAFRESCGGFFLSGSDITPLYFTIEKVRGKLTPSHVVSHVQLINKCWDRGYRNLYRFLRHELMKWESPD
jgi:hypothetical protein